MPITPTQEQADAVEAFRTGDKLKLNAYAGTGKTTTLRLMAESTGRSGIYISFNKSIAQSAGRTLPDTVRAVTSHALAFRSVIQTGFSQQQMIGKLNVNAIAQHMNLAPLPIDSQHRLTVRQHAHVISETIRIFCQSAKESIGPDAVPVLGGLALADPDSVQQIRGQISRTAGQLWERMASPAESDFPLGHDGYFKLWAASRPQIPVDYVLLDEAQDSNGALLHVLSNQNAQVVYVGDRFQQIYEWRGAVNAMESIRDDGTLELTQSFRFGNEIADVATKILCLLDATACVHGSSLVSSKIGCSNPDTILSRTNASLIAYVIAAQKAGRTPYIVGGITDLRWLLDDVTLLRDGKPGTHPEFFGFNNWHDVRDFADRPEGQHLKTFVRIVDGYGERSIRAALVRTASNEAHSDLVLSTAHRAKGREWSAVMLDDDFFEPRKLDNTQDMTKWKLSGNTVRGRDGLEYDIAPEELRLLYVACTRAKLELQIPKWCVKFLGVVQETVPRLKKEEPPNTVETQPPNLPPPYVPPPDEGSVGRRYKETQNTSGIPVWIWLIIVFVLFVLLARK